jgi:hypothetical protein
MLLSWAPVARSLDRLDEAAARRYQAALGARRWVVSWHPEPGGGWRARLSGPQAIATVERSAPTRFAAIARTSRAMQRLPALRARIGPRPDDRP